MVTSSLIERGASMRKIDRLEAELHGMGLKTLRSKVQQSYFLLVTPSAFATPDQITEMFSLDPIIQKYFSNAIPWRTARLFQRNHLFTIECWDLVTTNTVVPYYAWVKYLPTHPSAQERQVAGALRRDGATCSAWCLYEKD